MGKESACNAGDAGNIGSIPGSGRSPEIKWQHIPVFLPGKSHDQRSLVCYSSRSHKDSHMTTHKHTMSMNRWCHPTISYSVTPFFSWPQSFPSSRSSPKSQLFVSAGQSNGASAPASVLSMNIQGWFPLGLTGWISLLFKGLSRIFSSTTVWKHQFFGTQPSLWSNSHICTWFLGKP